MRVSFLLVPTVTSHSPSLLRSVPCAKKDILITFFVETWSHVPQTSLKLTITKDGNYCSSASAFRVLGFPLCGRSLFAGIPSILHVRQELHRSHYIPTVILITFLTIHPVGIYDCRGIATQQRVLPFHSVQLSLKNASFQGTPANYNNKGLEQ